MFKKESNTKYKIIGESKDNILTSLHSGLYSLDLVKTFMGTTINLERTKRYENSTKIPSGIFLDASNYIDRFFDPLYRKTMKSLGMMNKLNVIFNGKPGTGKTHLACVLAESIVNTHNAIGVVINNIEDITFSKLIDDLRINDDDDRLVVIVLDEIEKNSSYNLKSSEFLGFLDGADSRENVIIIGTSNSVEDLPHFLTNRPGRFEKIWEFDFTSEQVLKDTIEALVPLEFKENEEVKKDILLEALDTGTETIDHLRFLMLNTLYSKKKGVHVPFDFTKETVKHENLKPIYDEEKLENLNKILLN